MADKQDEMVRLLRSIDSHTGYIDPVDTSGIEEKLDTISDQLGSIDGLLRDILESLAAESA
jgi:hypothetical protein